MSSTYETLAEFARSGGTIYCFALFLGVLVYAGETFKNAAESPLRED